MGPLHQKPGKVGGSCPLALQCSTPYTLAFLLLQVGPCPSVGRGIQRMDDIGEMGAPTYRQAKQLAPRGRAKRLRKQYLSSTPPCRL